MGRLEAIAILCVALLNNSKCGIPA
jgi:hypothetical protein